MKIATKEFEINRDNPFEGDLLNRKPHIERLARLIETAHGGFVLSIIAEWGYGKTTFVRMLQGLLEQKEYRTFYVNAWEYDYAADPFMAIVDEISTSLDIESSREQYQWLSAAVNTLIGFMKISPTLSGIANAGEALVSGINKCQENTTELLQFKSYKNAIEEFKEKLHNTLSTLSQDKPVVIFIDELDRCRPDYAIEFLERIKHLFSIDNIVFILSINKDVIIDTIKGYYNSSDTNAENYLRRFIDLEFYLPEPCIEDFVRSQLKEKGISDYINNLYGYDIYCSSKHYDTIIEQLLLYFLPAKQRSLRDIEKYFTRLDLVLRIQPVSRVQLDLTVLLTYLYVFEKSIYDNIRAFRYKKKDMLLSVEKAICNEDVRQYDAVNNECISMLLTLLDNYELEIEQAVSNHSLDASYNEKVVGSPFKYLRLGREIDKRNYHEHESRGLKFYFESVEFSHNFITRDDKGNRMYENL